MEKIYLNQIFTYSLPILIGVSILGIVFIGYWLLRFFTKPTFKSHSNGIQDTHQNSSLNLFTKYWKDPLIISSTAMGLAIFLSFYIKKISIYGQLFRILTIAILTWLSIQAIKTLQEVIINNIRHHHQNQLEAERVHTFIRILVKIIITILIIIAVSLVLMTFPEIYEVGLSILASAGIFGMVVGFSAQKSLGNILTGIQLALTRPIKVGDVVVVNSEKGVIEKIGLTSVVMCTWDNRHLIIPTKYFIENIFQNWSIYTTSLIGSIEIEVSYTASTEIIREAFNAIVQETALWDKQIKSLQVINTKSKVMELRGLVSAATPQEIWDLQCHVREKLIEFLQNRYPDFLPKT